MQSAINSCNSLHLHSKHRRRDFRDLVFFFLEHGSVSTEEEIIGRRRSQFLRMFTGRTSTFLSLSGLHSLHYRLPSGLDKVNPSSFIVRYLKSNLDDVVLKLIILNGWARIPHSWRRAINGLVGELDEKAKIIHEDLTNHVCTLIPFEKL
ncbi:uncharacterized protein LOC131231542 isoform X1 [Magnolia sinica]|uniref:uncharacterized protein LOC131231542 isoform X1 n=1 Tax=Magnolia sinica TaxID=86752 RepID=UPI002657E5AD|nr:uncharacterized protein LOC131231542 isoform X1 [Magnolia sinica]